MVYSPNPKRTTFTPQQRTPADTARDKLALQLELAKAEADLEHERRLTAEAKARQMAITPATPAPQALAQFTTESAAYAKQYAARHNAADASASPPPPPSAPPNATGNAVQQYAARQNARDQRQPPAPPPLPFTGGGLERRRDVRTLDQVVLDACLDLARQARNVATPETLADREAAVRSLEAKRASLPPVEPADLSVPPVPALVVADFPQDSPVWRWCVAEPEAAAATVARLTHAHDAQQQAADALNDQAEGGLDTDPLDALKAQHLQRQHQAEQARIKKELAVAKAEQRQADAIRRRVEGWLQATIARFNRLWSSTPDDLPRLTAARLVVERAELAGLVAALFAAAGKPVPPACRVGELVTAAANDKKRR